MAATRLHRRLGTTFDGPVDVLGIARSLDLVLMMQPLDNLLGFYVRGDRRSGIVINSLRPESLQRFTLAHEIGHHVLGHQDSADDQHAVDRFDPDSPVELAAQAFAASLLMPRPLVTRALRDLPATRRGRRLARSDAYLFSRQLGVSYEAGVWALFRDNRLSLTDARAFIKRRASAAKNDLRGQAPVGDARADVWMLTQENDDLTVMCRIGDEIHVQLPEDTSTGMAWLVRAPDVKGLFDWPPGSPLAWSGDDIQISEVQQLDDQGSPTTSIELVQDSHLAASESGDADTGTSGPFADYAAVRTITTGPGVRSLTFVARAVGSIQVLLELTRPWTGGDAAYASYQFDLRVRPKQLAEQGLLAPSTDDWADEHVVGA
ncbi:ImmA/IrrE family metallo-endopeptidase [Gordonia sp. TBRC 11910]|uniref:ImmA/IrrE family metallo-endopeptidase n=1 Tax=Gordonia asplenii TaxID=2725283 RepID=A0A848L225_9ACTN|nr:ImmA/IrrE family metallo-endopeptidase [Gordonia asplenii]NMO04517.1 ImmA/IrrE family metallo-endopeptidase [Gordonia asplenii]